MIMKELSFHRSTQNCLLLQTCSSIGLMWSHGDKVCYLRDLSKSSEAALILTVKPRCSQQTQVTYHNVWMQNTCLLNTEIRPIVKVMFFVYVIPLRCFIMANFAVLTFNNSFHSLNGMENICPKCLTWKHFYNKIHVGSKNVLKPLFISRT